MFKAYMLNNDKIALKNVKTGAWHIEGQADPTDRLPESLTIASSESFETALYILDASEQEQTLKNVIEALESEYKAYTLIEKNAPTPAPGCDYLYITGIKRLCDERWLIESDPTLEELELDDVNNLEILCECSLADAIMHDSKLCDYVNDYDD